MSKTKSKTKHCALCGKDRAGHDKWNLYCAAWAEHDFTEVTDGRPQENALQEGTPAGGGERRSKLVRRSAVPHLPV
jgi:hypothetical protein